VLEDTTISREKAHLRAVALQLMGEAFMNVKKEDGGPGSRAAGEDSDYVKIDTKTSRARDAHGQGPNHFPNEKAGFPLHNPYSHDGRG